jgi:hypothetical protein
MTLKQATELLDHWLINPPPSRMLMYLAMAKGFKPQSPKGQEEPEQVMAPLTMLFQFADQMGNIRG